MKKRMLAILIVLLAMCAVPQKVEAASSQTMKKAYVKYLKTKVSNKKYYYVANIGKGNKPALLIAKGDSTKKYDIENGSIYRYYACDVYYYVKGKVKKIGTFSEGARPIYMAKKGKQYYLRNGLSDAAYFAYISNNKLYTYEFYKEWGVSRLKVGKKTVKKYGRLSARKYNQKQNAFKDKNYINFKKNNYNKPKKNTTHHTNSNNTTNNNNSNNSNTVTVQPSIRISGGYTGSGSCTLSATTVPGNLYVSWSSSNPSVATVNGGRVTAKAGGTTRITASINYGGRTYSASKNVTVGTNKSYGAWSGWTIDPIAATASREVRTTALYRYYYFYCPVCGGREPLQGISDCHSYTLTLSNGNVGWFPIPYSQCASAPYSYAPYKRYTTSLGDGRIWNFSTGNLYHTAIGTKDTDSGAEVIKVGYSYRNVSTWSYIQRIN